MVLPERRRTGAIVKAERAHTIIAPLRGSQCWLFLLGAVILLWPALLHGDFFVFNDTVSYLRGADTLFVKLLGHQDAFFAAPPQAGGQIAPSVGAGEARKLVLYGRSIYFGLFAYSGLLLGSLWVPIVLQALAASAVVVGVVRHFVDPEDRRAFRIASLIAILVLAVTPLPFFVCYLMPDLAVGLALVAAALLLCGWQRERATWRYGLMALVIFAALAHSSAVAVIGLLAMGWLVFVVRQRSSKSAAPALLLIGAALCGIIGEAAFGFATRMTTGIDPVRPPFLTARLIEDGPARRFQNEFCGDMDFVLCRYPIRGSDVTAEVFLWDANRPQGGFKALPTQDAIAVSREQTRFTLAVAMAYPGETARALGHDILKLATNLQLTEFTPAFTAGKMSADGQFADDTSDASPPLANRLVSAITVLLVLASLTALPWIIRSKAIGSHCDIVFSVVAAIVLNDLICGCLSGPFARYNTRVIWALPLVVLLFVLANRNAKRVSIS